MRVWTVQPLTLYEKLSAQGTLYCDPAHENFLDGGYDGLRPAYDWIAEQMKLRVGHPPNGVQYPIWAWAIFDGKVRRPGLNRYEYESRTGKNVMLELEIPDSDVLLSDEATWWYAISNNYFPDLNVEEDVWEKTNEWFYSLPFDTRELLKLRSWERILDKNDPDNDWRYVQATFWELKASQIRGVHRFTGRGTKREKYLKRMRSRGIVIPT